MRAAVVAIAAMTMLACGDDQVGVDAGADAGELDAIVPIDAGSGACMRCCEEHHSELELEWYDCVIACDQGELEVCP